MASPASVVHECAERGPFESAGHVAGRWPSGGPADSPAARPARSREPHDVDPGAIAQERQRGARSSASRTTPRRARRPAGARARANRPSGLQGTCSRCAHPFGRRRGRTVPCTTSTSQRGGINHDPRQADARPAAPAQALASVSSIRCARQVSPSRPPRSSTRRPPSPRSTSPTGWRSSWRRGRRSSSGPRIVVAFDALFEVHFAARPWRGGAGAGTGGDREEADGSARTPGPRLIETSLDRPVDEPDHEDASTALLEALIEALRRGDTEPCATSRPARSTSSVASDRTPATSERYLMHRILRALELSQLMARALGAERLDAGAERHRRTADAGRTSSPGSTPSRPCSRRRCGSTSRPSPARCGRAPDRPCGDRGDRLPRRLAAPTRRDARGDPTARPGARDADGAAASAPRPGQARHPTDGPPVAVDRRGADRPGLPSTQGRPTGPLRPVRRLGLGGGVRLIHADAAPGYDLGVPADANVRVRRRRRRGDRPPQRCGLVSRGPPRAVPGRRGAGRRPQRLRRGARAVLAARGGRHRFALDDHHHRRRPQQPATSPGRALKAIHARARHVYLLNPEPAAEWDTTDSIVDVYRPYLDAVFEVRNLRQLADAVLRIG